MSIDNSPSSQPTSLRSLTVSFLPLVIQEGNFISARFFVCRLWLEALISRRTSKYKISSNGKGGELTYMSVANMCKVEEGIAYSLTIQKYKSFYYYSHNVAFLSEFIIFKSLISLVWDGVFYLFYFSHFLFFNFFCSYIYHISTAFLSQHHLLRTLI